MMIEIKDMSKSFGSKHAVSDLNLEVAEGELWGLIGPAGAGKSTVLSILAAVLRPTSGQVRVHGLDVVADRRRVWHETGFLPDCSGTYPNMTVVEYLEFYATLYEVPRAERMARIEDLLALVQFSQGDQVRVGALSAGDRRVLTLAKTLMHDPKVILLDEPAAGMDAPARIQIRKTLRELQAMGKTILIASNVLVELEDLCDRYAIMNEGRLIAAGELAALLKSCPLQPSVIIVLAADAQRAVKIVCDMGAGVQARLVSRDSMEVTMAGGPEAAAPLIGRLTASGLGVKHVSAKRVGIEELFLELTGQRKPYRL